MNFKIIWTTINSIKTCSIRITSMLKMLNIWLHSTDTISCLSTVHTTQETFFRKWVFLMSMVINYMISNETSSLFWKHQDSHIRCKILMLELLFKNEISTTLLQASLQLFHHSLIDDQWLIKSTIQRQSLLFSIYRVQHTMIWLQELMISKRTLSELNEILI